MDLLRDGAVDVEPRRNKHELGTPRIATSKALRSEPQGAALRNSPPQRRLASPGSRPPPDDCEIQVIALLDGRVESVHVNVKDIANPSLVHWNILADLEGLRPCSHSCNVAMQETA